MKLLGKRSSGVLLSSAGALTLLFAATVPVTTAHAGVVPGDDCIGTCAGPEGVDISNREPEAPEPDSGSEGGTQSEPGGDNESDVGGEGLPG